ncbi:hypothetical protein HYDPIDRAFT_100577 [Hydnomerulius pinastri MD-312]|uniref:Unplaced genomic scaffold scaffold_52, whole genome shotgun sequence n=1 Tax=Hydnomerulius pinastri MD-312 TaxID=994086 RepID=A0A0C9W9G7_9AGAM|nr:hypothetical protein HYDPIDRAFT_100577 [Hydnomerulius pinastri MD-312]
MHDIHDGTEWVKLEVGLKRERLPNGTITDIEESPGSRRPLVSCEVGLSMTLNIDWFGITDNRPHSSGAVYVSFNNLHRSVRYLTHNVHLALVIPGPKEPSLENLNHCIEPLKNDIHRIYKGIFMRMYGFRLPREVQGAVLCENSDIPATRKLTGTAGHSHKTHPCNFCFILLADIDTPTAYDITNFQMRDDWEQLQHAERSRLAATKVARKDILDTHGVRYSILNELPGWLPRRRSPIDFMHNFYALVKRFLFDVITDGHLLDSAGWTLFQDTINSIIWPTGIGRLPKNLGDDHALPKADQWRRLSSIYPFVLWICWRDQNDKIKASAPPVPASAKPQPSFRRDLSSIYKLSLYLSVAERILASKAISVDELDCGQTYLQLYCQGLQALGVHQTINSHLAMHYSVVFRQYGPAYATWLFGFERFNGVLESVNLNGHSGGEMEYSLARDWIEKHRLYELAISLPDGASDKERKLIGGSVFPPLLTEKKKFTDLRALQLPQVYGMLVTFLREQFHDLNVVDDMTADPDATIFFANRSAKVLPFIFKDGVRYGSVMTTSSDADQFASVLVNDTRLPCKLVYHFQIFLPRKPLLYCSVIQRMVSESPNPSFPTFPMMPWDRFATDLGVNLVYENVYMPLEVIASSKISCPVSIIPVTSNVLGEHIPLWIVQACDRSGLEAEDNWLADERDEAEQDNRGANV